MKIFAVGMNYADHNKELQHAFLSPEPTIFMKSDPVLKDGKPFFLPDFTDEVHYETELVIKINRLGKNIDERFAARYYDEVTVGIDFTARDRQRDLRSKGLPWELCKAFDNAAAVGRFVPLQEVGGEIGQITFRLDLNGQTVQLGRTADMLFPVDRIVAFVSRFFTLRMGDLIYTGTPSGVGPVAIGDHLEGFIGDKRLLDFYIK